MTSKFNSLRTIPILKSQPPRKIVAIHVQEVAKNGLHQAKTINWFDTAPQFQESTQYQQEC